MFVEGTPSISGISRNFSNSSYNIQSFLPLWSLFLWFLGVESSPLCNNKNTAFRSYTMVHRAGTPRWKVSTYKYFWGYCFWGKRSPKRGLLPLPGVLLPRPLFCWLRFIFLRDRRIKSLANFEKQGSWRHKRMEFHIIYNIHAFPRSKALKILKTWKFSSGNASEKSPYITQARVLWLEGSQARESPMFFYGRKCRAFMTYLGATPSPKVH